MLLVVMLVLLVIVVQLVLAECSRVVLTTGSYCSRLLVVPLELVIVVPLVPTGSSGSNWFHWFSGNLVLVVLVSLDQQKYNLEPL